eukprot:scaffold113074_cov57-Phaeocystis_antarctica.AAC.2
MILSCWSQCALLASRLAAHCGSSEQATAHAKGLLPLARNGRTSLMHRSAACGPSARPVRCGRQRNAATHSHCSNTGTFATSSRVSACATAASVSGSVGFRKRSRALSS